MIEVNLSTAPLATRAAAAPWAAEVWPIPAHGRLHLALPTGSGPATAALLDATGRVLRAEAALVATPEGTATLDVSGLSPGLYVLRLRTAAGEQSRRVVLE